MGVDTITFGKCVVSWNEGFEFPVSVNHNKLNGDKPLAVVTDITYDFLGFKVVIPKGFAFDGASIPWLFQWMPGYSKIGWHLFADLIHDFSCDFPDKVPRPVGDGIYLGLLLAIADKPVDGSDMSLKGWQKITRRRKRQAWIMHQAVSFWTLIQWGRGVNILSIGVLT